jgi:hypothetical protein
MFNILKSIFFLILVSGIQNSTAGEQKDASKAGISPVPFTAPPAQRQWRLGFRSSAGLDMIEIQPSKAACEECDKLSARIWPPEKTEHLDMNRHNVLALPFEKDGILQRDLVNPEKWYLLDIKGNIREVSVNRLASVFSQVSSGCCYLATELLGADESIELDTSGPVPSNLFVAFTSKPDSSSVMRRSVSSQKTFTDTGEKIPAEYIRALDSAAIKQAWGEKLQIFRKELHEVSIQDFDACLDAKKGVEKFRTVNWISGEYTSAFAIYRQDEKDKYAEPVAVYFSSRQAYNDNFRPKVEAAVNLGGDGADELIMSVLYSEGNAFRVFEVRDGKLNTLYESGYYGL